MYTPRRQNQLQGILTNQRAGEKNADEYCGRNKKITALTGNAAN